MIAPLQLPPTLSWLVDEASAMPGADRFLAALGTRLVADGLPLAGGALTQAAPHPIIARRTWLWRADTGVVLEALGFGLPNPDGEAQANVGRDWLAGLGTGIVREEIAGGRTSDGQLPDGPLLGWAATRPFSETE